MVAEDAFQAQTCVAWKHWLLSEPNLAVSALPEDISAAVQSLTGIGKTTSTWTDVCLIKAAYIKGTAQSQTEDASEALQTFQPFVPWIDSIKARLSGQPQLSYWSEQMLAQMALVASADVDFPASHSDTPISMALQAFRLWADLATRSKEVSYTTFGNSQAHLSNLRILKGYYGLVTRLLQDRFNYPSTDKVRPRLRQSTELRNVERMYENELLRKSRFPKAQESNTSIEDWVEQVIANWEILCGSTWREIDLGEGGRNAVGRNVLDILYRAATKTFHSTLILRRLFQVHKSLTDFDLAYKALDTYIELIERGRARAERSHGLLTGQDGDEVVLRTVSEGIEGLCSFGFRDEAEKAYELAVKIEGQLPSQNDEFTVNGNAETTNEAAVSGQLFSLESMGIGHRAIGIAQAHWAKWTPITESRSSLQAHAVSNLKCAVDQLRSGRHHLESVYALGLLLAETRDINKAIEYVTKALAWDRPAVQDSTFATERKLVPLWHLLALLLTARQDFETSDQTCGAAFEQFPSSRVLFGSDERQNSPYLSPDKQTPYDEEETGLVEEMEIGELERIIEVRVTELALIEVSEGPEEAVNMTNELLILFSRLVGRLNVINVDKPSQSSSELPKSSASTIKSFRGSLFGRKKQARPALQDEEKVYGISTIPEKESLRQPTRAADAPTIEVTDEHDKRHHIRLGRSRHSKQVHPDKASGHKTHRRPGSITGLIRRHSKDRRAKLDQNLDSSQKQSSETTPETAEQSPSHNPGLVPKPGGHSLPKPSVDKPSFDLPQTPVAPTQYHDSSTAARNTLKSIGHNAPHNELPPPPGHESKAPEQDVRLPAINPHSSSTQPTPRFPKSAAQKHGLIILVKIWLLIAGLYRRAMMFDDSREACDEADRAAMRIESLVAVQESSARAFASPGWGGGKSSDEVWADTLCERGALASAEGEPKEAVEQYEQALLFWPDHTKATVGLSNILLDMFEQKGIRDDPSDGSPKALSRPKNERMSSETMNGMNSSQNGTLVESGPMATRSHAGEELKKTPENLNRLAARDRAYGLLSNLTKLGTAWDDSEAWFALARASELSGQVEKSKEILWWCIELEDRRPVRSWRSVTAGSYVL